MTCPRSGDTPDFNSSSEINASSLAMCKSTKGRPESSSRSSGASRNPSFSLYHSRDAGRFRTSIAQLSAMEKGGLPHINIVLGRILAGTAKSCEVLLSSCGKSQIPSYRDHPVYQDVAFVVRICGPRKSQ